MSSNSICRLYDEENSTFGKSHVKDFGGLDLSSLTEDRRNWMRGQMPDDLCGKEKMPLKIVGAPLWPSKLDILPKVSTHLRVCDCGRLEQYPYLRAVIRQVKANANILSNLKKVW